jgi:hypothetical protein
MNKERGIRKEKIGKRGEAIEQMAKDGLSVISCPSFY